MIAPDRPAASPTALINWREALPSLNGGGVTLRELELCDAASLLALLTTEEVVRFISPPPTAAEGFEQFITRSRDQRQRGTCVCFAVVPHGLTTAVGLFQIRQLETGFATAEWGFALGSAFWGTGVFIDGARAVVDFAVDTLGVRRLEARAALLNGRGNGALRKIGAAQEAVLRRSFLSNGQYLDQVLWSIIDVDWRKANSTCGGRKRVH